ncbi:AMP-binding protein, partial [Janthinobacterium sp. GMG1]|uniref:AMP-binding protein n=1 Tax=Janthinobacterium sp. GMG1 TaxID=3096007 RepID=UPI002ACAA451
DSSYHEGQETGQGMVPIGRPFAGSCLYVLDAALALVAPGVKGELCIGGPGVARGYLGLPQLSAEKFVRDPYSQSAGGRLYRTGDLARIRADGVIELVGRADNQIKLRGFRIELGEIETALLQIAGIRQAVVNVYESQVGE